ncbi:putative Heat shock protein 70 family [Helianthus anomalus]
MVEDSRGGVGIKIDEELTAMVLGYGMRLAEFHSKVMVKDAVVTVPPYFGQVERKGLLQAAELTGLNVLALVNEHSGDAL